MRQSMKLVVGVGLVLSGALAVAACVGDEPATTGGGDNDASGDGTTNGDGAGDDGSLPTDAGSDAGPPLNPADPIAIAAGADHACALRFDHKVYCWGDNGYAELGPNGVG